MFQDSEQGNVEGAGLWAVGSGTGSGMEALDSPEQRSDVV